jgi:hypothetical protein
VHRSDFDLAALYEALDERRRSRGLSIGFPRVMPLTRWLGEPAVTFTRIADW